MDEELRMISEEVKSGATGDSERLKIQPARNVRFAASAMPNAGNGDNLFFGQNFVNDAVRTEDHFANRLVIFFRHNTADLRKLRERVQFGHETVAERFRNRRIVPRDEQHDGLQIITRLPRPDYLESHAASCRLTSACGIVSLRSIWSRPLWIAARNSSRSA